MRNPDNELLVIEQTLTYNNYERLQEFLNSVNSEDLRNAIIIVEIGRLASSEIKKTLRFFADTRRNLNDKLEEYERPVFKKFIRI